MNYGLSEAEAMLERAANELFERECSTVRVREIEASQAGFDRALWRRLGELGWLNLGLPGTESGSFVDAVIFAEALGRAIVPVPFVSSIITSASLLLTLDTDALHSSRVKNVLAGESAVAFAMNEAAVIDEPALIATSASLGPAGEWRLSGEKRYVEDAAAADCFLAVARTGTQPHDLGLFLVERSEIELILEPTVAGDTLGALVLDGTPAEAVGRPGAVWPMIARSIDRARIAHSAKIAGMAATALDLALDYAKTRIQFGRPIGSFQTLQHRLADLVTEREAARFLAYHAAWLVDQEQPYATSAAMALHSAIDVAERLAIETAHIFGGYGVSVEHDIQLYYRRLRAAEVRWGSAEPLLETVAAAGLAAIE